MAREVFVAGAAWVGPRGADDEARGQGVIHSAVMAARDKGSAGEDPVGSSYSKDSKRKISSTPRGMIRFSAPQLKREAKRH